MSGKYINKRSCQFVFPWRVWIYFDTTKIRYPLEELVSELTENMSSRE